MFHVKQARNSWLGPHCWLQLRWDNSNGAAIWAVTGPQAAGCGPMLRVRIRRQLCAIGFRRMVGVCTVGPQ